MPAIDLERMKRLLVRCRELSEAADVKPIVRLVYTDRLAEVATEFLAAHDAMPGAESKAKKELRDAVERLDALDQPYREARAVYLAYFPDAVLPETLKARPTDTDKKAAVATLLDLIDDHVGAPWADDLLAGPFGQNAGACVQELDEVVAANEELSAARARRAQAYGPAYEAYLAFKNVVRNAHGPKSLQYRRIHLRANGKLADEPVASPSAS